MRGETLVYRPNHPMANENGLVPRDIAGPRDEKEQATYVISDTLHNHIKHPGTGAMIDSKSRFRQHTRDSGCVEVGTDPAAYRPKPRHDVSMGEIVTEVKRSIAELNR